MTCHVAILRQPYVQAILSGAKTVESRLSKAAVEPYGCVQTGERIFIKASGGPFMAMAVAGKVTSFANLQPGDVTALQDQFNDRVAGDETYWQAKRASRFATFIELCEVEPANIGPTYGKSPYKAWFTLPDEASPVQEVTLTDGAIRNRYIAVREIASLFGEGAFTLELPDGQAVKTELYEQQRVRWRGWRACFEAHGVQAGDRVRFVALGGRRYRVRFVSARREGNQ